MDASASHASQSQFDRRLPLPQQVYADLRRRIVALELLPDAPLSRIELSEHYQISQTPLREALLKLSEEGLVATYPQSRTEVRRINVAEVVEAHFLRTAIEVEVVTRLAESPAKSAFSAAEATHDELVKSWAREQSIEVFSKLDRQFHHDLFGAAGMSNLVQLIDSRCGQLDRMRRLHLQSSKDGKPDRVVKDHQAVLDAINAGDVAGAQRAMRSHLAGTIGRLDVLRAAFPDYFC
jgi:DNA-binding GntR family transcriptional regulator